MPDILFGAYKVESPEDPYADQIKRFIVNQFHHVSNLTSSDVLNLIGDAIISTGQVRYGPRPSPESMVAIRQVITHWVDRNMPIPFLVPWGSVKGDFSGVDIAELFALKTMQSLNDRVKRHYNPGVTFVIRMADISALHLFYDQLVVARPAIQRYESGFSNLVELLSMTSFITPFRESTLVSEPTFNNVANGIVEIMKQGILLPEDTKVQAELAKMGWTQPLTAETTDFYFKQYDKLYPDDTRADHVYRLARYFSEVLTRIKLGTTGYNPAWEQQNLELSFMPYKPGLPSSRAARRIHYRTMPADVTSHHMTPWRAKGYLCVNELDVTAQLAGFHDGLTFTPYQLTLRNDKLSQVVQADYQIRAVVTP